MEAVRTQLAENEPSDRGFGFLVVAAGLGGLGFHHRWLLAASAVLSMGAAVLPRILRGPKRVRLSLGFLLSLIANPLVLSVLFFGVITPAGLLMRGIGRDPLRLKPSARSPTYWIERAKPASDMKEDF
jgi:hypothetical protein